VLAKHPELQVMISMSGYVPGKHRLLALDGFRKNSRISIAVQGKTSPSIIVGLVSQNISRVLKSYLRNLLFAPLCPGRLPVMGKVGREGFEEHRPK
jgi:hypothetical protein